MKSRFVLSLVFFAATSGFLGAQTKSDQLHQPQKLTEGVWAMTTKGGSNAGWFLFGDGVICVDTGSDETAEDVLSAISKTTGGKKISALIVTSDFTPHARGATAFSKRGAKVISHESFGPYFVRYLGGNTHAPAGGPSFEVITLSERLVMTDGKRFVEIDYVGPADSGGDLVIYLPNEQVLFSGDLAETAILPPLFSKTLEPEGWISALAKLAGLKIKHLVPGYGPIGPIEGIASTYAYLQETLAIAKRVIADNIPDNFLASRIQEPDLAMKNLPAELKDSHRRNVEALVQRLKTRTQPKPSDSK